MILYHGSTQVIDKPDLAKSKPNKDFGRGFYLSADKGQALKMAQQKFAQIREGSPVVTCFLFDESNMRSDELSVRIFDDYSKEWAEFILENRNSKDGNSLHQYDIVYGPIADDGVTYQLRRYMSGYITIDDLVKELTYSKGITFQYFFGTEKALKLLKKI